MKQLSILFLFIFVLFNSAETHANPQLHVINAFDEMKSLVGVWHKEGVDKPNLLVTFELIANRSVLVETWLRKGKKHSFTMYHLDNDNLMATHYCPQGNQPRLILAKNTTINNLSFSFLDATNLVDATDSHQHSLGFTFSKNVNKVLRTESYLNGTVEDSSELSLVRQK